MEREIVNVAIDGPSGAGKSSTAALVARRLGYAFVSTGALYRAVALAALRAGCDLADEAAVAGVLPGVALHLRFVNGKQRTCLGQEDVTSELDKLSMESSAVGAHAAVRSFLLDFQRNFAREHSCILEGRDIGTVVLRDAQVKIFLEATLDERAECRFRELQRKGIEKPLDAIRSDIERRDLQDTQRANAPLRPAEDAVHVRRGGEALEQVAARIVSIIQNKLAKQEARDAGV
ncbi:MAG: (d)CMP kinase [Oscillospiraceae bacterium]|jgi:cytidylate kinase|nr:(d)CMP kinase [Oscillospiraceae bacterium]